MCETNSLLLLLLLLLLFCFDESCTKKQTNRNCKVNILKPEFPLIELQLPDGAVVWFRGSLIVALTDKQLKVLKLVEVQQ